MKIKKINNDVEINVAIKKVRLPDLNERAGNRDECAFIDDNSFEYNNGRLYHAFFKEFIRDEEKFGMNDEYYPVYGNENDCSGVIDLIPVIEVEGSLEVGAVYIAHNIPFIASSENKLICLTRKSFYMVGYDSLDLDIACDFLDEELGEIQNW